MQWLFIEKCPHKNITHHLKTSLAQSNLLTMNALQLWIFKFPVLHYDTVQHPKSTNLKCTGKSCKVPKSLTQAPKVTYTSQSVDTTKVFLVMNSSFKCKRIPRQRCISNIPEDISTIENALNDIGLQPTGRNSHHTHSWHWPACWQRMLPLYWQTSQSPRSPCQTLVPYSWGTMTETKFSAWKGKKE